MTSSPQQLNRSLRRKEMKKRPSLFTPSGGGLLRKWKQVFLAKMQASVSVVMRRHLKWTLLMRWPVSGATQEILRLKMRKPRTKG